MKNNLFIDVVHDIIKHKKIVIFLCLIGFILLLAALFMISDKNQFIKLSTLIENFKNMNAFDINNGLSNFERWQSKYIYYLNFLIFMIAVSPLIFIMFLVLKNVDKRPWVSNRNKAVIIIYYLFIIILPIIYSIGILRNANFVFYWDDGILAAGTWQPFIGNSRFCPLALINFLPVTIFGFGGIPFFYFLTNFIIFILTLTFLYLVANKLFNSFTGYTKHILVTISVCGYLVMGPLVSQVYYKANIIEALFTMFLIIFVYFFILGYQGERFSLFIAFIIANIIIYTKEFNFVPFVTLAFGIIIFKDKNRTKALIVFSWGLLVSALVFLLIYFFLINRFDYNASYLNISWPVTVVDAFIQNTINMLFFPVVLVLISLFRLSKIIFKNERDLFVFDLLFFAGFSIFVIHFAVKFVLSWYFVPGFLLVVIPIIRYAYQLIIEKSKFSKLFVFYFSLLFVGNIYFNISSIVANQVARKNDMAFAENILNVMDDLNIPCYTPEYNLPLFQNQINRNSKWDVDMSDFVSKIPDDNDSPGIIFDYKPPSNYILFASQETSMYDTFFAFKGLYMYIDKSIDVK